ncbi:hypothetical protein INT47_003108, partial [Mucor saturninus]
MSSANHDFVQSDGISQPNRGRVRSNATEPTTRRPRQRASRINIPRAPRLNNSNRGSNEESNTRANENTNNADSSNSGSASPIRDHNLNRACHDNFEETNLLRERRGIYREEATSDFFGRHILQGMTQKCPHCHAMLYKEEQSTNQSFSFCCSNGKVKVDIVDMPTTLMQKLLTGEHPCSTEFRKNIRMYNNAFAFTSFGADHEDEIFSGSNQGSFTFRIQGGTYHRSASLTATEGRKPVFAQVYFSDPNLRVQQHIDFNEVLDRQLVSQLNRMMDEVSPYANLFDSARKRLSTEIVDETPVVKDLYVYVRGNPGLGRQYDLPMADEVAAYIADATVPDESARGSREVVIFSTENGFPKKMNDCHRSYDSLHFALMFPSGEDGWNTEIELNLGDEANRQNQERDEQSLSSNRLTQKKVSLNQFYQHRLQVRPGETMTCHFGRLFHLYIVDMYCKIEGRRLYYLRTNQSTLRSELYSGLADMQVGGDMSRESIGKRVILPSSHTGSPRALHQMQQDAMAVVRALGKPDLFVTITCNPNWKEITDELLPGEVPSDRPDLICRVFDLKLKEIFADIKDKMVFGKVKGLIHVIEYQKRGLPHAHVVIILAECSKLQTAQDIDKYISAEIPDPARFPKAHKTITKHMMRTPCSISLNDSHGKVRMCRDNKEKMCSKHFPKDIQPHTVIDEKGFAKYKRRTTNLFVLFQNGYHADNRWVVPHNLYLAV